MLYVVLLQLRSGCVTGGPLESLGTTWRVCESVALGVYKTLRVGCDIILWLFLSTQTFSSPSFWEKRAVGSCPLPEAVPWEWHWCLPHWAKAWASLAESVSPFGSALAPAVQREWMWQRTQEEGREGSLASEQRLCETQQKNLYFLHPFMVW